MKTGTGLPVLFLSCAAAVRMGGDGKAAALHDYFSITIFLLSNLIAVIDVFDLIARIYLRKVQTPDPVTGRVSPTSTPLAIVSFTPYQMLLHCVPMLSWFRSITLKIPAVIYKRHATYREHLWIIDDASTDNTWEVLQQSGVHSFKAAVNMNKPVPSSNWSRCCRRRLKRCSSVIPIPPSSVKAE